MERAQKVNVFWLGIVALAITAFGVFHGWLMNQSMFPPSGGGWRCYRDCMVLTWLFALGVTSPYLIVKGSTYVWRRILS